MISLPKLGLSSSKEAIMCDGNISRMAKAISLDVRIPARWDQNLIKDITNPMLQGVCILTCYSRLSLAAEDECSRRSKYGVYNLQIGINLAQMIVTLRWHPAMPDTPETFLGPVSVSHTWKSARSVFYPLSGTKSQVRRTERRDWEILRLLSQ